MLPFSFIFLISTKELSPFNVLVLCDALFLSCSLIASSPCSYMAIRVVCSFHPPHYYLSHYSDTYCLSHSIHGVALVMIKLFYFTSAISVSRYNTYSSVYTTITFSCCFSWPCLGYLTILLSSVKSFTLSVRLHFVFITFLTFFFHQYYASFLIITIVTFYLFNHFLHK